MKTVYFVLLALIATSFSKSQNGDIAQCVQDIQNSLEDIKTFAHDIRSHHYMQAIHEIIELVETVESEKEVCKDITKEEVIQYIFEHLPQDIKQCIADAAGLH